MKRKLRFIRLSERWFIDIMWEGSVDDLEMVGNANTLLTTYNSNGLIMETEVSTIEIEDYDIHLTLNNIENHGAVYQVHSERFNGDIWLCNVTQYVFGDYPRHLFVKIL